MQAVPHTPQFRRSACRYTQVPAQFVNGDEQTHLPPAHVKLPGQATPQKLQLLLLVDRSAHVVPQSEVPERHWATHWPLEQYGVVAGQALPHTPQLALSDVRSTQLPRPSVPGAAHWVSPEGHVQARFTQSPPAAQMIPHALQLLGSMARLVQTTIGVSPCIGGVMQVVRPASPQPATHVPPLQVLPPGHALPQAPQLLGSVSVLMQRLPHSLVDPPQLHTPPTQFWPVPHAVVHEPQWPMSVTRSTHALLQLVSGFPASFEPHTSVHAPVEHVGVAGGQTSPQPPQLLGSLCMAVHEPLQMMPPFGHPHTPAWHVNPVPHCERQVPQFELSVFRSTQTPPHIVKPGLHAHAPAEQVALGPHLMPQPPQLLTSFVIGMHVPPQ
jgi:hypothetical protein